ncbi:GumC domain-containing protein [Candidatus Nitrospira nitrosa]|nr:hypothetical protein [Candidatus Nitrospira nitrosa]
MADKMTPLLIGQKGDLPKKERYTTVSITQGYTERMFNGVAGMTTRKIRVCGVKLIWDEYENTNPTGNPDEVTTKLFNYSGSNDIESLEMYADEIIIRSPLVFPQTDLWICTRKLVFEGNGSITTTPIPHPPAYTTKRDNNGRPLNEQGQIEAKNGLNGARGGHIMLCLPESANIAVPASPTPVPRFITVGGKGQDAESGGYLDYVPKENQRKNAGDKESLKYWESKDIEYVLKNSHRLNWPSGWRDLLDKSYSVIHVKVVMMDDLLGKTEALSYEKGERVWPGGVPDAFPSGKAGDGGDGGMFRCFWAMNVVAVDGALSGESTALYVQTESGEPGMASAVAARRPQATTDSSRPPAFVTLQVTAQNELFTSKIQPSYSIERCPLPILAGQGAASRNGQKGQHGSRKPFYQEVYPYPLPASPEKRKQLLDCYPNGWPNHLAIEPALQYARDAYLNGYRDEAREILTCYRDVIEWVPEDARSAALVGQATEIAALLTQLKDNLDYYGNPPGWLPRLSLMSNLQLFLEDQKNAVSLLYFAYKLEKSWAQVQNHAQLLKSTRQALSAAIALAKTNYSEGLALLESSRKELATVQGQAQEIGRRVKALDETITKQAVDKAKEQAILTGICGIASGLCKVIPVGQPFLGAASDAVFQPVANIDLSNPNAAEEAFKFAGGIGEGITTFVTNNRDDVLAASDTSFTKKLERIEGNFNATEEEISTINGQIETEFDSKVGDYKANLEKEIATLEEEAKTITDEAKKKQKKAKALSFKEELALYKNRKLDEAVVRLRQQIADADTNALTKAERDAKDRLLTQVAALQGKKDDLAKNSIALKQKQSDQQKFLGEAMTHAARIGQGVSTMAAGLTKLVVPVDRNSPEVQAIKNKIAESAQYKAEFQGLMDSLDKLVTQKAQLLEGVERAQHTLSESCATISKSLLQSAAIGRQMQTMGNALDLEVKLYARALRQRSEERLRKSLYHVVKSYEYHTLSRVPQDFFQTSMIEKIKQLEEAKLAAGQLDQTLAENDFNQIYETVFKAKFAQLGQKITDDLQRVRPSMENRYLCTLKPAQLTQLTDTWRFTFRIVEDFAKTSGNSESVIGARIIGIALKTLDIATTDRGLSLDVEFTHSGKHLITAPGGFQYFFQIGKYPIEAQDGSKTKQWVSDQPISWRMVYNAAAGSQTITLDEQAKDDQIVQFLLREYKPGTESDAKMLQEHRPGFTSEITLTLDGGLDITNSNYAKKKSAKSFNVRALEFWVFFKRQ